MAWATKLAGWTLSATWMMGAACAASPAQTSATPITPGAMPRVGTVDERFQSYNIEAVEVTGGRFWKPYASVSTSNTAAEPAAGTLPGMDPSLYEYRAPIDLSNPRLRKLAAALGPAYVRVSGTWMNSTYFQDSDDPAPSKPPAGFNSVLTRKQWKGVIDFAHAVNARIVTSFALSAGTRDAAGVWTPKVAQAFMTFTKSSGGSIAAAEFMNEPTFPDVGGAPKGYDAQAFARDFAVFHAWANANAPEMRIEGPGGVGEGTPLAPAFMHLLTFRGDPEGDGSCLRHLQLPLLRSGFKPMRGVGLSGRDHEGSGVIGGLAFARSEQRSFLCCAARQVRAGKAYLEQRNRSGCLRW